jgi:hypothetical protein
VDANEALRLNPNNLVEKARRELALDWMGMARETQKKQERVNCANTAGGLFKNSRIHMYFIIIPSRRSIQSFLADKATNLHVEFDQCGLRGRQQPDRGVHGSRRSEAGNSTVPTRAIPQ